MAGTPFPFTSMGFLLGITQPPLLGVGRVNYFNCLILRLIDPRISLEYPHLYQASYIMVSLLGMYLLLPSCFPWLFAPLLLFFIISSFWNMYIFLLPILTVLVTSSMYKFPSDYSRDTHCFWNLPQISIVKSLVSCWKDSS